VLPRLGIDYTMSAAAGSWPALCPACKRKTLSVAQRRIKEESRG
jgi:NNP family nitrate/nitrite transporter-like MFS transporter